MVHAGQHGECAYTESFWVHHNHVTVADYNCGHLIVAGLYRPPDDANP